MTVNVRSPLKLPSPLGRRESRRERRHRAAVVAVERIVARRIPSDHRSRCRSNSAGAFSSPAAPVSLSQCAVQPVTSHSRGEAGGLGGRIGGVGRPLKVWDDPGRCRNCRTPGTGSAQSAWASRGRHQGRSGWQRPPSSNLFCVHCEEVRVEIAGDAEQIRGTVIPGWYSDVDSRTARIDEDLGVALSGSPAPR